jgi:hypothetical protein
MKVLITLLALTFSLTAKAGLKEDFAALNHISKGPFGLNMLQGSSSRGAVNDGHWPSKVLFQAAYRNETAEKLVANYGLYTGNLFATNYYELMGEYVYGDAHSNHPLDHDALIGKGAEAIGKANLIVQNWVLEKHYAEHFLDSRLSRAFKLRGISGSEFETTFAQYFFNFYLSSMTNEFQYLPAFLLVTKSPIVESSSLQRARDLISNTYDFYSTARGTSDPMVAAIYKLRNAIHNQLSKDVIRQIDAFEKSYPSLRRDGDNSISEIRSILVAYYSFGPDKIAKQAAKLGFGDIKAAAEKLAKQGANEAGLLELSKVAADWRTNIANPSWVENGKRGLALALVSTITQYLNKELMDLRHPGPQAVEAAINTVYAEGFLIKDNWDFFAAEARGNGSLASLLADVIEVASGGQDSTLAQAFSKAYPLWLSAEPKMQYFMDNTIKSSSLATAAAVAEKVK